MRLSMLSSKKLLVLVPVFVILLVTLAACTSAPVTKPTPAPVTPAPAATPVAPSPAYSINIANKAGLGDYLVDSKGMSLYYFTKDTSGKSNATAAILQNWPVFKAGSILVPASLNAADFGTITRDDGSQQTTYKGWPLYYFAKDQAAGDTLGQGVNSVWFVAGPSSPVAPPVAAQAPATSPPPARSGGSYGY